MKKISMFLLVCLLAVVTASAKPKVHILATGGTIAGVSTAANKTNYTAGQVAVGALLSAVPGLNDLADITGEQIVNIGSQDMNNEVWLKLAKRINALLAGDVDAIVITHGTDTMEETAFFLNLVCHSDKPIILVGSMRPSTSMSADGPQNIYDAVSAAIDPASKGKGVMIAMNGLLLGAHSVLKTNTTSLDTFQDPDGGPLGYIFNGKVFYKMNPMKKHTTQSPFNVDNLTSLPKVGIVYSYANIEGDIVEPLLKAGYKGIIHAGVGNGNIHKNVFPVLEKARKQGILVVRSSRVPTGATTLDAEVDDNKYQFIASQELNPQKSRVLLMLALTQTNDWQKIQQYFNEF
jgi:L-asparaginase